MTEAKEPTTQSEEETNHDIDLVIDSEKPEEPEEKEETKQEEKTPQTNSWKYIIHIVSFAFFGSIAVCLLLSCYYRLHLLKNKRAPFNAPKGLKPLFPMPVNYEYEITQLCDKYRAQ